MEGVMPSRKKRSCVCKNSMAEGCVMRPALGWDVMETCSEGLERFGAIYIALW